MLNNLKRISKNPRLILTFILSRYCHWIDDKTYLCVLYFIYFGKLLHLRQPRTFNEKLQWLKLYDRHPEYAQMVDKATAKKYVASIIGEKYIIPTLGVWKDFDDIDFEKLPSRFVLKCTHDSGGVVICENKNMLDIEKTRAKLLKSLKKNYYYIGREYPYKNIEPRIIAEEYMVDESHTELKDYKIHLFHGIPHFIQVDFDRFTDHHRNLYTIDWKPLRKTIKYPAAYERKIDKPIVLDEMLELAKKLAFNIPYVRADFYCVGNNVYFGELTLYHGSGFEIFSPKSFDVELGALIKLP